MDQLKAHWPLLALVGIATGLFVAENKGVLTSLQVESILTILGLGTGKQMLHMTAPTKEEAKS